MLKNKFFLLIWLQLSLISIANADEITTNLGLILPSTGVVDSTRHWGDKLNYNTKAISTWIAAANTAISNINSSTATIIIRLDNLDSSTGTLTTRINNLDASTATLTIRSNNLDSSTSTLTTRINNLDASTATLRLIASNTNYLTVLGSTQTKSAGITLNGDLTATNIVGAGANITALNASNITSGTLPDGRVNQSSVTVQGNLFNGASQLLKIDSNGYIPNELHNPSSVTLLGPTIVESELTLSDNTTNDVSTTKHGFAPKSDGDPTKFLSGANDYRVPAGAGDMVNGSTEIVTGPKTWLLWQVQHGSVTHNNVEVFRSTTHIAGPFITSTTLLNTGTAVNTQTIVFTSATTQGVTHTIPLASAANGLTKIFQKVDVTTNIVTISDGSTVATLNTEDECVTLISDGVRWKILNRRIPTRVNTFTPTGTMTTNTTYTGKWWRTGEVLNCSINVSFSGAPDAVTLTVNLPTGFVINTAKINSTSDERQIVGNLIWYDAGTPASMPGVVYYNSTTSVKPHGIRLAAASNHDVAPVTQTVPNTWAANDVISFSFSVPISGWGD